MSSLILHLLNPLSDILSCVALCGSLLYTCGENEGSSDHAHFFSYILHSFVFAGCGKVRNVIIYVEVSSSVEACCNKL